MPFNASDDTFTVANADQLNQAIADLDAIGRGGELGAGAYTIKFTDDITLGDSTATTYADADGATLQIDGQSVAASNQLYALNLDDGVLLAIDGAGHSLSGDDKYNGLFVYAGAVTVENVSIENAKAVGGQGAVGGGGGAGLGGGLFVAAAGDVTLANVDFTDDSATGGAGGAPNSLMFGGGGGGLDGGEGGSGGGGAGFSAVGGSAGNSGGVAGAGILLGEGGGGEGLGAGGVDGGGGGGGGGSSSLDVTYGGGGGISGGAGGSGVYGHSGAGGFGGGGGGGSSVYQAAGEGGFGGGGGGGWYGGSSVFGGGGGAGAEPSEYSAFGGAGGGSNGAGGGGLGAGGDVFVQQGGDLAIDGGSLGIGAVSGGAASGPGSGVGGAFGAGMFIQGDDTVTIDPGAGQTETISGDITDELGTILIPLEYPFYGEGVAAFSPYGEGGLAVASGTLILSGDNTFVGGATVDDATLQLAAPGAAGFGPITFEPLASGANGLVLERSAQIIDGALDNWLYDFGPDDGLDLAGLAYTDAASATALSLSGGVLTVAENGETESFSLGDPGATTYYAHDDGKGGTLIDDVACYIRGTQILTGRGEVAVEALSLDDLVITASGVLRPIRWIGHRAVDCSRHPDPKAVQPLRVARDALGEGLPHRDLWLSPGHNVACEGALVPISALVNGVSVAQEERRRVEYWHVELFGHDLLVAEGLPAESYLDTGNRTAFADGGAFMEAYPDFKPKHWAETCLPLASEGALVVRAKARLIARLIEQGYRIDHEADAHVLADGRRVEPTHLSETRLAFVLPRARKLSLCSNVFIPAHIQAECADFRELGLCIGGLQIDSDMVALEGDELPPAEWGELERDAGGFSYRWTKGAVEIPVGARVMIVDLANRGSYWRAPKGGARAARWKLTQESDRRCFG